MTGQKAIFKNWVEVGCPRADNFLAQDCPVPELKDGHAMVELVYVSVDPYMRGQMRNAKGYFFDPFQPGQPCYGGVVCRVTESKAEGVAAGACYSGMLPWVSPQAVSKEQVGKMMPVDTKILADRGLPMSCYVGELGMTGMTAYCSFIRLGQPKAGETVFISGAAGAVGAVVGMIAKNVFKCHVVGSAGSDEKVALLTQRLGFDAAFNYKKEDTLAALGKHCPKGIDIYYDNVGGATLEAALEKCNRKARVVACGAISQYNDMGEARYGVKNLFLIVTRSIRMEGFLVMDFLPEMLPEFFRDMPDWLQQGKVKQLEHLLTGGLRDMGRAFEDLFTGKNTGKVVVQCAPDPLRK